MAKKAKGKGNNAVAKLPAGFSVFAVGGAFGAWWNHHEQKSILGKIVGYDSFKQEDDEGKKVTRNLMRVQVNNGTVYNVGESSALKELFTPENKKALRGKQIYIRFMGQKSFKKGRQTRKINQFQVAVK